MRSRVVIQSRESRFGQFVCEMRCTSRSLAVQSKEAVCLANPGRRRERKGGKDDVSIATVRHAAV
jgi:hypothetical protein